MTAGSNGICNTNGGVILLGQNNQLMSNDSMHQIILNQNVNTNANNNNNNNQLINNQQQQHIILNQHQQQFHSNANGIVHHHHQQHHMVSSNNDFDFLNLSDTISIDKK